MKSIKKAYIEITNCCNLSCEFCPGTERKPAFMSAESFETILDRLKGKVMYLYFHVMGEPLLHPELDRFLDLAELFGFRVNITTNGTLIGKNGHKLLSKLALRQVSFSMHSLPGIGGHEEVLRDIFSFIKRLRIEPDKYISLRFWNLDEDELNPINEEILKSVAAEYGLEPEFFKKREDNRGVKIAPGLYLNFAARFEWPGMKAADCGTSGFCQGLRDQIGILCDGTVVPCCLDGGGSIPLGNIFEQTIDDIIGSDRAKAIFDGFSNREVIEELCLRCGYRKRFGH